MSQSIYQLMPKIMGEIGAVSKNQKNEQQGYKFRGIDQFLNAAHPVLAKYGVFVVPKVKRVDSSDRVLKNGSTALRVEAEISYTFYAPDGSSVEAIIPGEGIDSSDKATNKALSAALKYCLIQVFAIPTEDMEEADKSSPDAGVAPLRNVERTEKEIPLEAAKTIIPPKDQLITVDQARNLHKRFKEELCDELKPQAEALLHDFLGRRLFLDENGNPSAKAIPKEFYISVGKDVVALAKQLSEATTAA